MKIELGPVRPDAFKEQWAGQYEWFSHFEFACGIPQALFLVTTIKENGKPNACFHSWSTFASDGGEFFAVMAGIGRDSHTHANIMRTGEFCVNFLGPEHIDGCMKTVAENADETDEIAAGGFTAESAACVSAPRIAKSFLTLECKLEAMHGLSPRSTTVIVVGRVVHVAAAPECARGIDAKYGPGGFMLMVHSPRNLETGEGNATVAAILGDLKTIG